MFDDVLKDIEKSYMKKNDTIIYDPNREKVALSSGSVAIDTEHDGGLCYLGRITQFASMECLTGDQMVRVRINKDMPNTSRIIDLLNLSVQTIIGSSIPDDGSVHEVSMLELMNLVENSKYQIEIDTPDGFQLIGDFALKGVKPTFKIGLEDGTSVSCSKGHLIETKELIDRGYDNPNLLEEDRSYLKAKWLQAGDIIVSRDGDKTVTSVEYRDHEEVYDIEVKHPNHRYYANGISHHNSGGKSTLAFQTALCACRDYPDQGVVYMDVEQHSDYTYLESLARKYGFDGVPKNLVILQPMSAEELEDTTGKFVNKMGDKIILLVIDSVAAAKPKSMLERKHGESGQKAEHAMFWNEFCPKLNNWAKKHDFAVLLINQLRAKPSIGNMDKFSVGNVGVGAGASSFDNSFTACVTYDTKVTVRIDGEEKEMTMSELKSIMPENSIVTVLKTK